MTPIVRGTAAKLGLRKPQADPCAVRCVLTPVPVPPMNFDDFARQARQVMKAFLIAAMTPPSIR